MRTYKALLIKRDEDGEFDMEKEEDSRKDQSKELIEN